MASAFEPLPNDVAALKAVLVAQRAKSFEIAAELAVARAKASEDTALIAAQKLRIAKLERQIYGRRSERSARLIEQLSLAFEELEASATEDAGSWRRQRSRRPRPFAPSRAAPPSAARSSITCRASAS